MCCSCAAKNVWTVRAPCVDSSYRPAANDGAESEGCFPAQTWCSHRTSSDSIGRTAAAVDRQQTAGSRRPASRQSWFYGGQSGRSEFGLAG
jgi:hypothetical protein